MIRIHKSDVAPTSLSTGKTYNQDDVNRQLNLDQNSKCYICERKLITDFEVEHRHSQANSKVAKTDWRNLFLACSYCNERKSDKYDNIADPTTINIEELILQKIDYSNKKAVFNSTQDNDNLKDTIELLLRIYNGAKDIRKYREERFFEYFMSEMNKFRNAVLDYQFNQTEENKTVVKELLDVKQEFLGFKYWIIKENAELFEIFSVYCKWNKRD